MILINVSVLKLHSSFSSIIFSQFRLISCILYNICFCKAALILAGLIFSHKLVDIAIVAVLITYLTDSPRNYNVGEAARVVNIQEGLSASMAIFMICISDFFSGRLINIIIYTTISYILGLELLCITAFEKAANPLLKKFILIGVVLLAVGKAGMRRFLGAFLADQLRAHEPKLNKSEDRVRARKRVWWFIPLFFSVIASVQLTGWRVIFIFTASATGIALFIFLLGIRFFHCTEITGVDAGSSLTFVFRVVMAALSKRHLNNPSSSNQLYRNYQNQVHLSPQVKFFRWLDKAAIIEPATLISPEEQEKAGRLCTVSQVRDTKLMLKMVPIWTTFVVFGLVVSTGQTFFPEQGNKLKGSITYLVVIRSLSQTFSSSLYNWLLSKWVPETKQRGAKIVRIWAGMVLSTFCCAVAWRVEVYRLIIINNKGLLEKTNEVIPMSIFWLAPQFCLLGLMEGLARDGVNKFLTDQFKSMHDYVSAITEFVIGFASFVSVVAVYFNKSLFANTLSRSRLDKYYKMLTIVSFINICYFWWISTFYTCSDDTAEADEISQATGRNEDEDEDVEVVVF